ncbi:DUF2971 domain-containing protein [Metallumcola ferriviriculae]|uniref:DUF2971 domain-containing protein n=1 Tax=Metallumcola ferriviriculae TaxID=3039180 RepID=A0AAU0UNC4_9FIRM|nr:DUF2971 domain-containing protein [Desulfitibacteraceae bacterium MK1]
MVYHYTSPDGLYAILKCNSLRFTDCQYMNDRSEFIYIKDTFLKGLKECEGKLKYKHYDKLIELAFSNKYGEKDFNYIPPSKDSPKGKFITSDKRHYIFCTSTADDSLGMWNYYVKGENYQGYNIGLDTDLLIAEAGKKSHGSFCYDLAHNNVIYDAEKQVLLLIMLLHNIDKDIFDYASEYGEEELYKYLEDSTAYSIFSCRLSFSFYRLLFKHPAFVDEREYRFILSISDNQIKENSSIFKKDYFVRNGVITPCCKLTFDKESIKNITVSPTMEFQLVKYSTQIFLEENGYVHNIDIKQSGIPIRY